MQMCMLQQNLMRQIKHMNSFWICVCIGLALMVWLFWSRKSVYNLKIGQTIILMITLPIVGFSGAKLLYIIENFEKVLSGGEVGMSFFGTVFIVPVIMPLIGKIVGVPMRNTLDICIPGGIAVLGCMRVNCFISGCCSGMLVHGFGTWFPLPVQLFEAIGDFMILTQILRWEKSHIPGGRIYPMFLVFYGILRFFLEWFRRTGRPWLGMSHGHWFSIAAITIGLTTLIIMERNKKHAQK